MSVEVSDDENSDDSFSDFSQYSITHDDIMREETKSDVFKFVQNYKTTNVASNLLNREIYGRFTKHPRAKTERLFNNVHHKCRFALGSLIKDHECLNHIFMGFTLCGEYFVSFIEKSFESTSWYNFNPSYEYELYLWRFVPGEKLKYVSKHRIFKQIREVDYCDKIMFMQFPMDPYKLICYGLTGTAPAMVYITILTLPFPRGCKHCFRNFPNDESVSQGWCSKHGFLLHYSFSMSHPCPNFDPHISMAYPNHLVINTGHYIHILNATTLDPPQSPLVFPHLVKEEDQKMPQFAADTLSEVSETPSEHFGSQSVIDAILEDFNEYDLEGNECAKPFHELNISCEPLNVTGKSYHNALVQNIVDPRLKRLQNSGEYLFSVPQSSGLQKSTEKNKIDKKSAEKAYEFIEENEKCEKLSSFRKKRLAEKKYEFSEDNSENIVPFNSLRRERRFLYKSQGRCIRSPDFNSIFLSPRSPMQSPNSRNGQFSPGGARNVYYTSLRNSPHPSKSPISPRDSARKFHVYSPSLDSDCSDSDSRLVLKMPQVTTSHSIDNKQHGLLIIDPKTNPKWIKKVVRRYSNGDFENSSLLSGQSKDDYNMPIEVPLLVHTLSEQHLEVVPDFSVDQVTEMQLIVSQRTFDCDQFVQRRAEKICAEFQLNFLHCEDYDIKIIYVCPLDGHILCQAVIKIGALKTIETNTKPENFTTYCLFTWNIVDDSFEVIEPPEKLQPSKDFKAVPHVDIPTAVCNGVLVMDYCSSKAKKTLRDYRNRYEICLGSSQPTLWSQHLDDMIMLSDSN